MHKKLQQYLDITMVLENGIKTLIEYLINLIRLQKLQKRKRILLLEKNSKNYLNS